MRFINSCIHATHPAFDLLLPRPVGVKLEQPEQKCMYKVNAERHGPYTLS